MGVPHSVSVKGALRRVPGTAILDGTTHPWPSNDGRRVMRHVDCSDVSPLSHVSERVVPAVRNWGLYAGAASRLSRIRLGAVQDSP
jgi:hypothetical protein